MNSVHTTSVKNDLRLGSVREPSRRTLQDIADAAGLSKAATSYALRGIRGSVATQAKVREIADELGYTVDPVARALASGRTGNVAITGTLRDLYRQGMAVMLSTALSELGLSATIFDVDTSPEREEKALRALAASRADAVIALPVDPSAAYWAKLPTGIRVVSIGDALAARPDAACVLFDNAHGVSTALTHLAGLGHRSIGILTPTLSSTPGRPAEVLAATLGAAMNLDVTLASSAPSIDGAAGAARRLLSVTPRPTALFCLSDSLAFGAYHAAREMNLKVPEDLSILGFDDSALAPLVSPALTTFGWDEQAIVDAAAGYLAEPVENDSRPSTTSFRPEFIERASTGPPAVMR